MKITLTGINFNYENGYNADFSSVNLNFNSNGETFNISGFIKVTKDQYLSCEGNLDRMKELIRLEVINKLQENQTQTSQTT